MRPFWTLPALVVCATVPWPGDAPRGGIPFAEWELKRAIVSPDSAPSPRASYQVASLSFDPPMQESSDPSSGTWSFSDAWPFDPPPQSSLPPDEAALPGSGGGEDAPSTDESPPERITPDVAIEDICVAMASAAQTSDLPVGFFARLIWQESKFAQRAVSPAGAQGVAQFMPQTANWIGLADPFDPIAALPASARFLKMLFAQFGNIGLAAAAYNAGPGRVQNWLAGQGALPEETRNYVRIITGHEIEKWTAPRTIEVAVHLPRSAPCAGLADLSRTAQSRTMQVALEPSIAQTIEKARIEKAKAEKAKAQAARAARRAAVKAARAKRGKAGKTTRTAKPHTPGRKTAGKETGKETGKPLKIVRN
jgi:soluble lytic murein transglycosylase-like protein